MKNRTYDIAIIGAGFAGIGAGIKLKQRGDTSFAIFERESQVGGTWRDNTYPGCACDIPSILYSYSFEPKSDWNHLFSKQADIFAYLKHCVQKYDIEKHIQYNTEIVHIEFIPDEGHWKIIDAAGEVYFVRMIIAASGPFNAARIPKITGQQLFKGEKFHSLHWNHDYDLTDKNVAVIGTGASAIQFVPEIAPLVKSLHVFQRTPPYVIPKMDVVYSDGAKKRYKYIPGYQRFWRELIYWFLEYRGQSQYDDNKMRRKRLDEAISHMHDQVKDPALRELLTPKYEIGCKRILVSDNYYPALQRENVKLVAEGVSEITENGIVTETGESIPLDAIIYGTGFYATEFHRLYQAIGLSGYNLFEKWNTEGAEAYYGITIHDYPNLAVIVGPNTGLGHNSIIHMMESQYKYILDYWTHLKSQRNENTYFNLKKDRQTSFNQNVQERLSTMVWNAGGCSSYYLKDDIGKNVSIWPGSTIRYRKLTKHIDISDYDLVTPGVAEKRSIRDVNN